MRVPALPSDAFQLGPLVVVPSLNRLVRGGQPEALEPRVMAVLAALAETPGEVVTRRALAATVWAGVVVNDEALTRAVSELRRALGPDAREVVETIRGRGYRLAASPEPLAPTESAAPHIGASPRPPVAPSGAPRPLRRRRNGLAVALALGATVVALVVWRPGAPRPATGPARPEAPYRLDSTSQYHVPGLSSFGVYYDSTEDRYFRFDP